MRALIWMGVVLLAATGCPKKITANPADVEPVDTTTATSSNGGEGNGAGSGWVSIDIDTEDEDPDEVAIQITQATAECGDLLKLEPSAMMGLLNDEQIRCLDDSLREAQRQTIKDKISRVLLVDAWQKGDRHRWEGIARRHLEQIDRSDADLSYQFAYMLVQSGNPDKMEEAVFWTEVSLENKQNAWEGDTFVRRVYSLHKFRTLAAQKRWEYLESQYRTDGLDATFEDAETARNELKTYAKEWLAYAKSSGRDPTEPMRVCSMAAGSDGFCDDS